MNPANGTLAFRYCLALQGGACALCGKNNVELAVHRDRRTGLIRGLLCDHCHRATRLAMSSPGQRLHIAGYLSDNAEKAELDD